MPIDNYFDTVFAQNGDRTTVPDATDPSGYVSMDQGYTSDYQLAYSDPDAKDVERDKMNYILYEVTKAIQNYQQKGTPPFITTAMNGGSPYSYSKYDKVYYSGVTYQSLENSNTDTPPSSKWIIDFPVGNGIYGGTSGGSANAYTLATTIPLGSLTTGQYFTFVPNAINTSSTVTLNVNSIGAVNLKIEGLFTIPLYALKVNMPITVYYDGTNFIVQNLGDTTGDVMAWGSSTVKPGWLFLDGTTSIGSPTSGATYANNASEGLYYFLWNNVLDAEAPVAGGRGANAAADFAANKKMTLPTARDKSPFGVGSSPITTPFGTSGNFTVASAGTVGTTGATTLNTTQIPSHTHGILMYQNIPDAGVHPASSSNTQLGTGITESTGGGGSHTHTGGAFAGSATSVLHPVFGVYWIIKI